MILNYRNCGALEKAYERGRCLVDGIEVQNCWYIDTVAGIVKTYDVIGYGSGAQMISTFDPEIAAYLKTIEGVEVEESGLMTRTIRGGKVEVYPPE